MINKQPNILFIMLDQWRFDWFGIHDEKIYTPNINRLAHNGTFFKEVISNSPTCVPSRASISSGLYPFRLGILNNDHHFPLEQPTFYQQLRKNGYQVGGFGKFDFQKPSLDFKNGQMPLNYHLGYTHPFEVEGKMSSAKNRTGQLMQSENEALIGPYQAWLKKQGLLQTHLDDYRKRNRQNTWYTEASPFDEQKTLDGFILSKAKKFLNEVEPSQPWFCDVTFVNPHDPWDPPEKWATFYQNTYFSDSIKKETKAKPQWVQQRQGTYSDMTAEDIQQVKRYYSAMVSQIDQYIGDLINLLDEKRILEETIIILTSDHGEMLGDHGLLQKQIMYEGSVRTPLIITDPRIEQIDQVEELVELVDLFPTILDFAGIQYKGALDGTSVKPLLTTLKEHKADQLSVWENTEMLRTKEFKYIHHFNDTDEFYHLATDSFELNNLSNHPLKQDFKKRLKKKKGSYPKY
ncbi:sulfatase [Alkalihalobacillus trypoxylicola]|uniref:Sulfatase N-terminal domain-containing protein n=1 Tax=Alkalihalobacillus trypoxylicola TaxID=519424 RepID=A0A162EW09_9BACI|nr:sulfatase-like hydrolase/transferase [Alkalihalobacillus trypoxylicola]KYG33868.1 hypothetical protein AZF04_15240 [Alkalihalobacillus trypoxylicola]